MSDRISVSLGHRFASIDVYGEVRKKLSDYWSYYPKGFYHTPGYKLRLAVLHQAKMQGMEVNEDELPGWDGRKRLLHRTILPAGLFRATRQEAESEVGVKFSVVYDLPSVDIKPAEPLTDPKYAYQDECIEAMCKAVHRGGGIVLAATRSGKTAITARFFKRVPYTCLFLVDQKDLLYQNAEEIEKWLGEKVGIVGDSKFQIERVTVGTLQTVQKHIDDLNFKSWFKKVNVVVMDELHDQMNSRSFEITKILNPIASFGVTATMQMGRKEVRTLAYAFAGPVIYEFPVKKGIEAGVLTNGKFAQLLFPPEPQESIPFDKKNPGKRYLAEYRIQVIENERKAAALSAVVSSLVMAGRYVLVLAERVEHIQDISERLKGIKHRLVFGKVKQTTRKQSRDDFEAGDVRLIIANKVFKKGITIKRLDAIVDAAEMKSKNDVMQKFGRGLGLHEDKTELLYIDFGTFGGGRFHKAARSRARMLKDAGIKVRTTHVANGAQAIKAVFEMVKAPEQLKLSV
jgi:superfamily II DNA or RNA helicase